MSRSRQTASSREPRAEAGADSAEPAPAAPTGDLDAGSDEPIPEDPRFATMRRLVNALLLVMIIGVVAVVLSLVSALRGLGDRPVIPGLDEGERVVSAEATAERVTLILESADGARRIVLLDAASFQPIGVLNER